MHGYYEELEDLFDNLTDSQRFRIICRYLLNLPSEEIAHIEKRKRNTITVTFQNVENKLSKARNHDELVSAIQELFGVF